MRMFSTSKILLFSSLLSTLFLLCLTACEERVEVPKPRAYPRVVYPEKAYKPFDASYCNFTFDMPAYATIEQDTAFFEEKPRDQCWFNLTVPSLNAKIYCSYYPLKSRKDFDELVADAFKMSQYHNIKASYIEEVPIHRDADHVHGVVFNVEGPVASSYQFFLSDSTHHFLRGALYFNSLARPDSLAPVVKFMKEDLNRLVETVKWNK